MSRARRAAKPALGTLISTAQTRKHGVGPRKVRAVADLLRGLTVIQAQAQLDVIHRPSSAPMLRRLLKSAVSNANQEESRFKAEDLIIGEIFVDGGQTATRYQPRAMGRASVIRKRTSHVTVKLYARPGAGEGNE